jgi:2'-hydroxyisoflavone reductase
VRLLILGGTNFVGRCVAEEAIARGWAVTAFNRGISGTSLEQMELLQGDRLTPADLEQLRGREWDAVVDTWSGAPVAVRDSARVLAESVPAYLYVSSRSVYQSPVDDRAAEDAPIVDAAPDADGGSYPECKAGAERALGEIYADRALFARAGLILGPYEDVGRLPWWLGRMARGGPVLAPGPRSLPLQYIDARDLAAWLLTCAEGDVGGAFNVVSRPGHTTMGELLTECAAVTGDQAELRWTPPEPILAAGVEPWTDLPIWVPPGHPYEQLGIHSADTTKAHDAGLECRPVQETVADTWAWLRSLNGSPPQRADRPTPGLDPERESAILDG